MVENPFIPIAPFSEPAGKRLYWSVMIPSYNAKAHYLEATLKSVLEQAPAAEMMEIVVVDDCSPNGAPEEIVNRIGQGRVRLHRCPKNLGLAGIWNRCIELAAGEWVHILHQDDIVMPGFYEAFQTPLKNNPTVGAAFSRHLFIDEDDHWRWLSDLEAKKPGVLADFRKRITVEQVIQTPAVVVRRSVYEKLGGFRPDLCYALDWEMWRRIAAHYPFYYEPRVLAAYRVHSSSATSRLVQTAADIEDSRRSIDIVAEYMPGEDVPRLSRKAKEYYALRALDICRNLVFKAQFRAAYAQLRGALRCRTSPKVLLRILKYSVVSIWQCLLNFQKVRAVAAGRPASS